MRIAEVLSLMIEVSVDLTTFFAKKFELTALPQAMVDSCPEVALDDTFSMEGVPDLPQAPAMFSLLGLP